MAQCRRGDAGPGPSLPGNAACGARSRYQFGAGPRHRPGQPSLPADHDPGRRRKPCRQAGRSGGGCARHDRAHLSGGRSHQLGDPAHRSQQPHSRHHRFCLRQGRQPAGHHDRRQYRHAAARHAAAGGDACIPAIRWCLPAMADLLPPGLPIGTVVQRCRRLSRRAAGRSRPPAKMSKCWVSASRPRRRRPPPRTSFPPWPPACRPPPRRSPPPVAGRQLPPRPPKPW